MQRILTANAVEGMTLAKDVEGPDGRLLCGRGSILDQRIIERLRRMDIASITVQGNDAAKDQTSIEEEIRRVETRFSRVTDSPPLMLLKKKIIEKITAARG